MGQAELSEPEYLRHIEHLTRQIVNAAAHEGWLTYGDDPSELTPLQQAVNEVARQIRHYHFDQDGCIDPELPMMQLAGAVILQPKAVPIGMEGTYPQICARLGVEARPEGWAIWNTWATSGQPISIIMVDMDGTEGMLMNWTRGIEVYPVTPLPAQVVLTRQGWVTPMTLSLFSTRKLGISRPLCWSPAPKSDASGRGTSAPG
ncbi:hypothetical protein AB0M44_40515 [Streptosporangium subroseum]|uniref:hypothetical protein n=1 Tax=Streptosporangium subroseum TaxID=106412 RepID=UPI003417E71C